VACLRQQIPCLQLSIVFSAAGVLLLVLVVDPFHDFIVRVMSAPPRYAVRCRHRARVPALPPHLAVVQLPALELCGQAFRGLVPLDRSATFFLFFALFFAFGFGFGCSCWGTRIPLVMLTTGYLQLLLRKCDLLAEGSADDMLTYGHGHPQTGYEWALAH
jgi:hypothetical protein